MAAPFGDPFVGVSAHVGTNLAFYLGVIDGQVAGGLLFSEPRFLLIAVGRMYPRD
jgi:hypothetical protein